MTQDLLFGQKSVLDVGNLPLALEELTAECIRPLPATAKVELAELLDEMAGKIERARRALQAALDAQYGDLARARLHESGRDSGTVHLADGELVLSVEFRKTVVWMKDGPDGLAEIYRRIAANGGNPEEYIDLTYAVAERKYNAWPETLKAPFRKARTVKIGKPIYTLALEREGR
ncbi:MAG: hypothetical protein ACOY6N_11615 [Pseudomonadota bacterium]